VCNGRAPLVITRRNARSVVLMSEEDYDGLTETVHLLNSPANAARLCIAFPARAGSNGSRSCSAGIIIEANCLIACVAEQMPLRNSSKALLRASSWFAASCRLGFGDCRI
jgi:hypothetical protein